MSSSSAARQFATTTPPTKSAPLVYLNLPAAANAGGFPPRFCDCAVSGPAGRSDVRGADK
jgi:hypothetical protein